MRVPMHADRSLPPFSSVLAEIVNVHEPLEHLDKASNSFPEGFGSHIHSRVPLFTCSEIVAVEVREPQDVGCVAQALLPRASGTMQSQSPRAARRGHPDPCHQAAIDPTKDNLKDCRIREVLTRRR